MKATEVCAIVLDLRQSRKMAAIDIEGGAGLGPACIGFATSASEAFVVPFYDVDGVSIWPEEDEISIWQAVSDYLEDPQCPKIIQNAAFEMFILGWSVGITICGLRDDTMVKHFECYAELDKALEFQAVLYTNQPFWKLDHRPVDGRYVPFRNGKRVTSHEWFIYNGTDCCVTFECNQVLEARLAPRQREHYLFNVSLLVPLAFMSLRGFRYDKDEAARMLSETTQRIYELQDEINQEAARSPERVQLRQFYEALGVTLPTLEGGAGEALGGGDAGAVEAQASRTTKLLPLLTSAFCCARRTEPREVEEVTWQPYKWNGRKWVKKGKRIEDPYAPERFGSNPPIYDLEPQPLSQEQVWLKPIRKFVSRRVPVEITSLADVRRFCRDSQSAACRRALAIIRSTNGTCSLSAALRGELATLLGLSVNINSTSQGGDAQWLLYTHWGLEKQYAREGNKLTDKLTTDGEAAIKAYLASGKDDATRDQRVLTFLASRWHDTQAETLSAECDEDGRIRCSYNLVGTETHRLSCSTSATGSGYNLQTVTKKLRRLFKADEGCYLCQRDLSGADGWTVAAYAASLGDSNMLDDYRAKLKPAQIIVLMLERGEAVNQLTRDELRPLCKPITEETNWRYFAMKRVQHGSSYLMGKNMTSNQILTDSFKKDGKPVYMSPAECERIQQQCFFVRYPGIKRWHEDSAQRMMADGKLTASNGFTRQFFGRKTDFARGRDGSWIKKPNRQTLGEWLAHLPQVYTTLATTLAILRLWQCPTNRRDDGSLIVEPLHTVHDSLITQWKEEDTPYARVKMVEWFVNPIQIASETLVIPASGNYGKSWGELEFEL